VNDGRKNIYSSSITYLNVFINSPPDTGQCIILVSSSNSTWISANSGRALLDVFKIVCSGWKDPNYHAIVKYVFKRENSKLDVDRLKVQKNQYSIATLENF